MTGLVLELQSDVLDPNTQVSDLLRKALVISKKLGVNEIEHWISNELEGYKDHKEIPDYRKVRGMACFSQQRYIDALGLFRIPDWRKYLDPAANIGESVSTLENLSKDGRKQLEIPFPPKIEQELMKLYGDDVSRYISHTEIARILNAVKNNLLQWALELEQKGITGEGMTFSPEEKSAAAQVTYNLSITNSGTMNDVQLQQGSPGSSQSQVEAPWGLSALAELIKSLNAAKSELPPESPERAEYEAELQTLSAQVSSPKPKIPIVTESLKSVRAILEGAAGNVLASDLVPKINALIALLLP